MNRGRKVGVTICTDFHPPLPFPSRPFGSAQGRQGRRGKVDPHRIGDYLTIFLLTCRAALCYACGIQRFADKGKERE